MHIVIDVRSLMHGTHSGVEVYTTALLRSFLPLCTQEGHHITFYYNSTKPVDEHIFSALAFAKDLPLVSFFRTRFSNTCVSLLTHTPFRLSFQKLLQKDFPHLPPVDVFFMPDGRPYPFSDAFPLFLTVHDLFSLHARQFYSLRTRLWQWLLAPGKLYQKAQRLLCVSHSTYHDLTVSFPQLTARAETLYEGAGVLSPSLSSTAPFPHPYILMLSTLEPRKNIPRAIHAFIAWKNQTSSPFHLLVVGKENPALFAHLDLPSPLPAYIHFTGFVSEEEKATLFLHAFCLYYPSLLEGFGLPLVEAMVLGIPVLTSTTSAMPEISGDAGIHVVPSDSASLVQGLETITKSKPLYERLASASRRRGTCFQWNSTARRLLELIKEELTLLT